MIQLQKHPGKQLTGQLERAWRDGCLSVASSLFCIPQGDQGLVEAAFVEGDPCRDTGIVILCVGDRR
ncbi:MAG: hypothetical protein ABWY00_12455 [Dongiaceae bacterium]